MKRKRIIKQISILVLGAVLYTSPLYAGDDDTDAVKEVLIPDAKIGKTLFEGSLPFENSGPSCIVCHNVTNDELIPGGLFAKDLTSAYETFGEGLAGWLAMPPHAPMKASYQKHPLTESERGHLGAFLKFAYENKDTQTSNTGQSLFFLGGGIGIVSLLILIQFIWMNRKKKMVKQAIFNRQNSARDAKF